MLAKDNDVVSRCDLADNEYSAKDPRLVTINEVAGKGDTPVALNFQQAFNAPNSPWLTLVRNAVLGDGSRSTRTTTRSPRSSASSPLDRPAGAVPPGTAAPTGRAATPRHRTRGSPP